jgi:CheY-like chemotaxis protein
VRDAYLNALKNACEATLSSAETAAGTTGPPQRPRRRPPIRVQVQAAPRDRLQGRQRWFVELVMENSGGPIPEDRLALLNAPEPHAVTPSTQKSSSTGIGVFLARYQLQNVVGDGADMMIVNLEGGVVQTRIRLPAELVSEQVAAPVGDSPEAPVEGDYVLYVEDDPEHYEPTRRALESLLQELESDVAVCHASNADDAETIWRSRLPRAVLSDLHIPKSAQGEGEYAMKHGIALIGSLLEAAADGPARPPVWILTAEPEDQVLGQFRHFGVPKAYRFERFDPAAAAVDAGKLAQPGTICVFSGVKRVAEHGALFRGLLETLVRRAKRVEAEVQKKGPPVVSVDLHAESFEEDLRAAIDRQARPAEPVYVVASRPPSVERLAADLHAWFAHPGIPDLELLPAGRGRVFGLSNRVFHKRIVLAVGGAEPLQARLPIRLLYWGLSRNVWLAFAPTDPAAVGRAWLEIRGEERGPLSTLRHDVFGDYKKNASLASQWEVVKKEIDACEALLLLPEPLCQKLDKALAGRRRATAVVEEILASTRDDGGRRQRIRESLRRVGSLLRDGAELDGSLKTSVASQCGLIRRLEEYFRLTDRD